MFEPAASLPPHVVRGRLGRRHLQSRRRRSQDGRRAGWLAARDAGFADGRRAGRTPIERGDLHQTHPWPIFPHKRGKDFVDFDEDLQVKDLMNGAADGYDDIELLKRYTTVGMGPSQGKHSAVAAVRILAKETGRDLATHAASPPSARPSCRRSSATRPVASSSPNGAPPCITATSSSARA